MLIGIVVRKGVLSRVLLRRLLSRVLRLPRVHLGGELSEVVLPRLLLLLRPLLLARLHHHASRGRHRRRLAALGETTVAVDWWVAARRTSLGRRHISKSRYKIVLFQFATHLVVVNTKSNNGK